MAVFFLWIYESLILCTTQNNVRHSTICTKKIIVEGKKLVYTSSILDKIWLLLSAIFVLFWKPGKLATKCRTYNVVNLYFPFSSCMYSIHTYTWISTKNTENQSLSKHINIYSSLEFPHCIVHSWMPSFITPTSCHNKIFQFSSEFH